MNIRLLTLMTFGVLVAQPAWAADSTHVGSEILDKSEIIQMLQPRPKTRGIRLNQPAAKSADGGEVNEVTAAAAPSISMEINFEYNSAILTDQSIGQLAPLGQALQSPELAKHSFMLEGHTDSVGPEEYNMSLSERRAKSVGLFLSKFYGVNAERLDLVGRGESDLLDPENPTSGTNRRVTITTMSN